MSLSICMMVKNEESNLERCLKSLANIRNSIESELIIVDTGSTDKTIDIAKKYTDQVYFHEWNNDFSQMRNTSISYASKEWILVFDADEEMKDDSGILEFLLNPQKYKDANTGLIRGRDFTKKSDEDSFLEVITPRLFKNDGEFRYEGRVHNQPIYKEPVVLLEFALLHHYGYDSENKELMEMKFNRTVNMLKRELEENPLDIYYRYQLSISYRMKKDYKNALIEIERAFEIMHDKDEMWIHPYVYRQYIKCQKDFKNEEKAIMAAEEIIDSGNANLDIVFYYADSLMKVKELKKAKLYSLKYIDLLNDYLRREDLTDVDLTSQVETVQFKEKVYADLVELSYEEKEYKDAYGYAVHVKNNLYMERIIRFAINSIVELEYNKSIFDFYRNVTDVDPKLKKAFFYFLENKIENIDKESKDNLVRDFVQFDGVYGDFNRIRFKYNENEIDGKKIDELLSSLTFDKFEIFYAELLFFKLKSGLDVKKNLIVLEKSKIKEVFKYLNGQFDEFKDLIINASMEFRQDDLREIKLAVVVYEFLLLNFELDYNEYNYIFSEYISNGIKYINCIYNLEIITKQYDDIEDFEFRFFAIVNKALLENKKELAIEYLQNAESEYKDMKKGIDIIKNDILSK